MPIDITMTAAEIEQIRRQHVADLKDAEESELRQYRNISGRLYPKGWRDVIAFDFSQCPHTTTHLVEVKATRYEAPPNMAAIEAGAATREIELGIWGMEICVRCGTQVKKECPHEICEWLFDGKLLVCKNCGVNAT